MFVLVALDGESISEEKSAVGVASVAEVYLIWWEVLVAVACLKEEIVVLAFLLCGKLYDALLL